VARHSRWERDRGLLEILYNIFASGDVLIVLGAAVDLTVDLKLVTGWLDL
jgi:hypothetical protein